MFPISIILATVAPTQLLPTLGSFTIANHTVGDVPFTLTPPTSNSLGTWTFTSSDANVLAITGYTATVVGAGNCVVTATQAASTPYSETSVTAGSVVIVNLSGTVALFALGQSTVTNLYSFAANTNNIGSSLLATTNTGGATANSQFGILQNGNTYTKNRNKYNFTSNVVTAATLASLANQAGSAVGTAAVGIFSIGILGATPTYSRVRDKYTYAGDVVSAGTSSNSNTGFTCATGNATVGIFTVGVGLLVTREKYTYAGDIVAAATAASIGSYYGRATGNSSVGIFHLGNTSTGASAVRNKYTYAGDTNAVGAAASMSNYGGAAAGNDTVGIFCLGYNGSTWSTARNKYNYASHTNSTAVAAGSQACSQGTGCSDYNPG